MGTEMDNETLVLDHVESIIPPCMDDDIAYEAIVMNWIDHLKAEVTRLGGRLCPHDYHQEEQ